MHGAADQPHYIHDEDTLLWCLHKTLEIVKTGVRYAPPDGSGIGQGQDGGGGGPPGGLDAQPLVSEERLRDRATRARTDL